MITNIGSFLHSQSHIISKHCVKKCNHLSSNLFLKLLPTTPLTHVTGTVAFPFTNYDKLHTGILTRPHEMKIKDAGVSYNIWMAISPGGRWDAVRECFLFMFSSVWQFLQAVQEWQEVFITPTVMECFWPPALWGVQILIHVKWWLCCFIPIHIMPALRLVQHY